MKYRRWFALLLALWLCAAFAQAEGTGGPGTPPDGAFAPDSFMFSGGSGKVTISCPQVRMAEGQAWATLVFSSPNYPQVKVGDVVYPAAHEGKTSVFEVPVMLNEDVTIIGTTTAMSQPHDVEYTVRVGVGTGNLEAEAPADVPAAAGAAPAAAGEPLAGHRWVSALELRYAEGFSVDYYEGGLVRIDIRDGDSILVVPEGMAVPEGLDPGIVVLERRPGRIYLAATSAMALFDRLDALDAVRLSSLQASGWHVEAAARAMEAGDMLYAGKYSDPDYELLLREGCDLAIESTMIFHTPRVREMLEQLGIPVIVDRSSYERHPLGRTEWIKLYAALVGREAEAQAFFDDQARAVERYAGAPGGGTVAFFYVASDGSVVVRGAGDYVSRMIELAGGRCALDGLSDPDSRRSSVSVSMEQFYAAAVDADYLIYNAAIARAPESLDDLLSISALFGDFRAVREGRVFSTGRDLYQETDEVGAFISDVHNMLTGAGDMRFLKRVP